MATRTEVRTTPARPAPGPLRGDLRDATYQAFVILWIGFSVAPVLFGIDKFFNWMTDWPKYLWVGFPHLFGVTSQQFMYGVGVVEIVGGLGVLLLPRFSPYIIAGWLGAEQGCPGDGQHSEQRQESPHRSVPSSSWAGKLGRTA